MITSSSTAIKPSRARFVLVCALAVYCALLVAHEARASCPFDDASCQEYCNKQGCNLGYCGHFAWIQCICRKCGDEWNWFDKVHYNPDKQVNQTELDSLKLNVSGPHMQTNGASNGNGLQRRASSQQKQERLELGKQVVMVQQPRAQQVAAPAIGRKEKQAATLTTLLIPDLSDATKLDLNDIPDENSEKFLDYLAQNHEKLVQATSSSGAQVTSSQDDSDNGAEDEIENESSDKQVGTDEPLAEETVEIQISSSNNQAFPQPRQQVAATAKRQQQTTTTTNKTNADDDGDEKDDDNEQQLALAQQSSGSVTRLLKMAVAERSSDDIF